MPSPGRRWPRGPSDRFAGARPWQEL